MKTPAVTTTLEQARRLAITRQHLAGPLPHEVTKEGIVSAVRDLAYVQWDPVPIVAPSHLLSLWARLGEFRPEMLERLLWDDKRLFEHWTPMASLVLTEDYPLYASLMRRYPASLSRSWGSQREEAKRFLATHRALRRHVLHELRSGPRVLGDFTLHRSTRRNDGDWNPTSDVSMMLYHLVMSGVVMVVGHQGAQNRWGLSTDFLPDWVDRRPWSPERLEREAAQRALRGLGVATAREITYYFPRGRYDHLDRTLRSLEAAGTIVRVNVEGLASRDEQYALAADLPALESERPDAWHPRMSLVPPFDNLVGSTARVDRLFGFHYIREQFLPAEKRRFGTYVLPIVWGERLIGRVDPRLDRTEGTLIINSVHAERGAPREREVGAQLAETVNSLARFVGAKHVRYSAKVPAYWRSALTGGAVPS